MIVSILTLLITPFAGALIAYFARKLGRVYALISGTVFALLSVVEVCLYYGKRVDYLYYGSVFGYNLSLRINQLSWLFLVIASSVFLLAFLFSYSAGEGKEDNSFYLLEFFILEGAVFGVFLAGDLFTFFMFWEMMAVLAYFLASKGRAPSKEAALKYFVMNLIGGSLQLFSFILLFSASNSFEFSKVQQAIQFQSSAYIALNFLLLVSGFLIKASVMPFHTWAPDAYAEAPDSISAVFASVLKKVGIYGFILFTYLVFGMALLNRIFVSIVNTNIVMLMLQWMAGLTIFFGTILAVSQEDPKRILAYSSIANSGYIVLSLSLGTPLGVASALFHLLNHSIFKALLFFSVGAAIFRTGTKNLSELGGLIKKMPVSFLGVLFAIIALAGMPPMNGFVSKWMIYQALIQNRQPLLFVIAMVGSVGSFLYVYRLIHSIFLGTLPQKYEGVKEAPFIMLIPSLVLMLLTFILGVFPGLALKPISLAQKMLGFEPISFTLTGFPPGTALSSANYLVIAATFIVGFLIAFALFYFLPKARRVSQLDNYAAGHILTKDVKYNYSFNFYSFTERAVQPLKKLSAEEFYESVSRFLKLIGNFARRVYTGDLETYVSYALVFIVLAFVLLFFGGRVW